MAQIFDTDPKSNEYFFITGLDADTLGAGKNSIHVNCTNRVLVDRGITVSAFDAQNKPLGVLRVQPFGSKANFEETSRIYAISVPETTETGFGKITISGVGIDLGLYTGSYAFYRGKAYPVSSTQRLPLVQAPAGVEAFPEVEIVWNRNLLIDTTSKTTSEITFFDQPRMKVKPQIYAFPQYPTASYALASGSCAGIALYPKNNDNRNFDASAQSSQYQLFRSGGTAFSTTMEGEYVRIKSPFINSFTYANYSNNQVNFSGVLNTDFIAKIIRVINSNTLLIDIPFATVSDLVGRINEDSPYNKNNLVDTRGYDINDDPQKQSMYLRRNVYVLSIGSANYEILYNNVPVSLPTMQISSGSLAYKSLLEIELGGLRAYSGDISSYKIYGHSLNSPESKVLMVEGKIEPDEHIYSNNFNNGLYNSPGKFYNQQYLNRFWLTSSAALSISQSNTVFINGAYIGHAGNSAETDFVIFKDDTSGASRTSAYASYVLGTGSYWYATADAFLNADAQPSASYGGIANIPTLYPYATSQENLLSGQISDSNPIKLRKSTLYAFSMRIKRVAGTSGILKIFFVSGNIKKQIGYIDNTLEDTEEDLYTSTFFSDTTRFGTIILVPIGGYWHISELSLKPHQAKDYSIDSFKVKHPLPTFVPNEMFEIEVELYDYAGRLAYGNNSYSFKNNRMLRPLTKKFFINPAGLVSGFGVGGGTISILDGGDAFSP